MGGFYNNLKAILLTTLPDKDDESLLLRYEGNSELVNKELESD